MLSNEINDYSNKPLIGISCCSSKVGIHDIQMVANKYITAAVAASNAIPVLIPALGEEMLALLPQLDGLYLTGSYSNVEPHHYGESPLSDTTAGHVEIRDKQRDSTNLALINGAVKLGMPVLGVCRGFQEMNVALGGSLHQRLDSNSTSINHMEDKQQSLEQQYAVSHKVTLSKSGLLDYMMQGQSIQSVNSLHQQGVNKLATSLKVEALAPDGLIEAFSLKDNHSFFLGLQWHPEWQIDKHPFYHAIFTGFGQACSQYKSTKQ